VTGIALLGAGFMADTHARCYEALGDRAQVRVVCGLDAGRVAGLAGRLGAQATADLDTALATPGVEAVDICLPTPLHRHVAEQALAAGMHVLVEKPVALTLEDADAIGAAARAARRVLMVGHVLHFMPKIAELRRVLASGELGQPLAATAIRLSAPPDWNDWMRDAELSGGVLVDLAIHDLDVLGAILGPGRRVHARAVGGHVMALVEHERGEGAIEGSHAMPASYPFTANLRVLCEGGALEHRFVAGAGDEVSDSDVVSVLGIHPAAGEARRFSAAADPWQLEIEHFLDCIERGAEPADGSFDQARAALAVALAARRSLETGLPEPV
jgi:UDP-N-acetylglucosamine 3-dehydrogenase